MHQIEIFVFTRKETRKQATVNIEIGGARKREKERKKVDKYMSSDLNSLVFRKYFIKLTLLTV